jgi:hypothetical protein
MKRFQQAREAPLMIRDTVTHWSGDISSAAPAIVFGARLPLAFDGSKGRASATAG